MLFLYILPTCPYCLKVIEVLENSNLEYELLDINNKINLETLLKLGGKRQVPFLVDAKNDIQLYESEDIIAYLETLLP